MTAAEQTDPLLPACAVLASELLGRTTVPAPGASSGVSMSDHGVVDDLEDEEFVATIHRPRPRATRPAGETPTTEEVLKDLNTRPGHRFQKMHQGAYSGSGEPDLDGCVVMSTGLGRSVKIEMKAPGKKPTAKQNKRLLQWQEAGALVGYAHNLDEVDEILAHLEDPHYRYTGQPGAPAPGAPPAPEAARDHYATDPDDPDDPPGRAGHPALSRRHRAVRPGHPGTARRSRG